MRFVFVSETLERVRGGIERHAAGLSAELARRGHVSSLVRPSELRRGATARADWLVFDGVHRLAILRHARRSPSGPGLVLFPHGSFLEEARREDLRRVRGRSPSLSGLARTAFDRTLGRRVFGRFDRWFVLAEGESADVQRLFRVPAARVSVLPLFLSPEFLAAHALPARPSPVPPPYLCAVSRIDRRKNFGRLLEAIDGTPYRFVLAGQDRGGLRGLFATSRRHPAARWQYLGPVSEEEKVDLMRSCEAVVLPSVLEGVPTLALESLVMGRRVVLAGVAYGPEGRGVVRCRPTPESLRTAIRESLAGDPPRPAPPHTVAQATDRFLAELGSPPANSGRR